jgi:hypothetical protein
VTLDPVFAAAVARCQAMNDLDPEKTRCVETLKRDTLAGVYSAPLPAPTEFDVPRPPAPLVPPPMTLPPTYSFAPPIEQTIQAGRTDNTMRPGARPPFCGLGSGADQISGICR